MADPVDLSERSIRAIAGAFADELNGSGRSSTTGGSGAAPGRNRPAPEFSASFFKGIEKFGDGLGRTFDRMDQGATGLSNFNTAIQGSQQFLTTLTGSLSTKLPILATALNTVGIAASAYAQQVNQLVDLQYESYQTLSKVGGADQISGLTGVMDTFNKFGYTSKADFPKLTALVQENAESFAAFGGTVETGIKQFGNVAAILQKTGTQTELLLMGMKPDEINKSFAALIKSTTMAGGSINNLGKTEEDRARSVKEYIKQQDIITRLTGITADAQQKAYEQSLSNDRYAVRAAQQQMELADAQASGDERRIEAAEAAIASDKAKIAFAAAQGPDVLAGMQDTLAGAVTEASMKLRLSYGENFVTAAQTVPTTIKQGQELFVQMAMAAKENSAQFIKDFGENIRLSGVNIGVAVQSMMKSMASGITPTALKTAFDEANTGSIPKPADPALANAVAVRQETDKLVSAFENFVNSGVRPVSDAMVEAARDMRVMAEKLLPGSIPKYLEQTKVGGKTLRERMTEEQGANAPSAKRGTDQFIKDQRTNANEAVTTVIEKAKETADSAVTATGSFLDTIKEFGQNVPDAVNDAAKKLKEAGERFRDEMNIFRQSISPNSPVSGLNFNSSSMARLLNDYRSSAGPTSNYRPSLVDTVYRPDAEDTASRYATTQDALAGATTDSNMFRDQMVAYETMIRQQGELIDLLQRSVGIQDKTLRATYNT
jgi:hypothetical protein